MSSESAENEARWNKAKVITTAVDVIIRIIDLLLRR